MGEPQKFLNSAEIEKKHIAILNYVKGGKPPEGCNPDFLSKLKKGDPRSWRIFLGEILDRNLARMARDLAEGMFPGLAESFKKDRVAA